MLIVADREEEMLKFFDRTSGRTLAKLGHKGKGPGEFQSIRSFQVQQLGEALNLWVFDSRLNRLVGYELSDSARLLSTVVPRIPDGGPLYLQWITDSTLVSAGHFNEGRFWLARANGEPIRPFGVVPLASEDVPVFAANTAMDPCMAVQPGGDNVAVGSRYASRVDIYDTETGEMIAADVPVPFQTEMKLRSAGIFTVFLQDGSTRHGYTSIAATKDKIYALFSGRTRKAYQERVVYGQQVHVFNWSGDFLGAIDLGRDIFEIAVDPAGQNLYGLSEVEAAVYEYDVSAMVERN